MQPQIITNKLGQARPISIYKSSPDGRARWVAEQRQAASLLLGGAGGRGALSQRTLPLPAATEATGIRFLSILENKT